MPPAGEQTYTSIKYKYVTYDCTDVWNHSKLQPSRPGVCNLFKPRATLKNTKLVAGRTHDLEPNDLNTLISLAINFNLTFTQCFCVISYSFYLKHFTILRIFSELRPKKPSFRFRYLYRKIVHLRINPKLSGKKSNMRKYVQFSFILYIPLLTRPLKTFT
jgi:hypothetical protein